MKLVKLIANLGYGSRREVAWMFREGRITDADGEALYADDQVPHARIRLDGEPLDPPPGLVLLMHKPLGATCSRRDPGRVVYDLLPPRYRRREPALSTVGQSIRQLGETTATTLLEQLNDAALRHPSDERQARRIVLPPRLSLRESTAEPARPARAA